MRGRQSDVVSVEAVHEMLALIPGSTLTADVADAGYMVVGDDNDVFTEALAGLLDSVAASKGISIALASLYSYKDSHQRNPPAEPAEVPQFST
ncbi:hypothetical protein ACU686_17215 [Yinghuangia aomiensis]